MSSLVQQDYRPATPVSVTTLEENTLANSQEAVPVPYIAGEAKIPAKWLTKINGQYTLQAESGRTPGKK